MKAVVVSDSGSNMVVLESIGNKYPLVPCSDHKISTCLTYVLNKTTNLVSGVRSKPSIDMELFATISA